ncbi:hypothetical protein EUX98_g6828 [Antrodiella citrinella]|uniref:Carboxypeptidase n=1 Tax=Antrodiella citrinella TaxID=2447956 RepID=A0A4S4MPT4_9APHY|nr:hypothetical protein EUX98_g6828 [Antrodiella citrinella]
MVGLLQEHGPCRINNDTEDVSLNPYSWNEVSNMIYIDQPVRTGFSYGEAMVSSSEAAAADLWKFFQLFFSDKRFRKYQKNDFGIWTESYGGHYGPAFASHFLEQNAAIARGKVSGVSVNVKFLGIGDGIILVCNGNILIPLAGEYNQYDVRATDRSYPPDLYEFLYNETVVTAIGSENTGDWMKNSRPILEKLIDSGVKTIIYNGDADYMFNYIGLEAMMDKLQTKYTARWHQEAYRNYTVRGQVTGLYKNIGSLSYARIFGAWVTI